MLSKVKSKLGELIYEIRKKTGQVHLLSKANDAPLYHIAQEARDYVSRNNVAPKRRVLIPTSYLHVQFNRLMDFILAVSLKVRGAEIVPVLCDGFHKEQCPVFAGAFISNFKRQCRQYCKDPAHILWEEILKIPALKLSDYRHDDGMNISQNAIYGINHENYRGYIFSGYEVGFQAAEVTANSNNLAKVFPGEPYGGQLRIHAMNVVQMLLAYERLIKEKKPEVVVGSLHDHYQWSALYHAARSVGLSYYSHTMVEKDGCACFGENIDKVCEVSGAWPSFREAPVAPEAWEHFNKFMAKKADGKATCFDIYPGRGSKELGELKSKLDFNKPVVFFPANTPWDNAIHNYCFVSKDKEIIEMARKTVRYFNRHPEFQLIIKAHPYEQTYKHFKYLPHTLKRILADMNELPGPNIFFIDSDSSISIFDIYPIIDLGIVHSSRSGCELAMYGKPLILAGDNHYRGKGFTIDVSSEEEFYGAIEYVLSHKESQDAIDKRIDLSRKYWLLYYFYGYIDLGLFKGGWTRPSELLFSSLNDLLPGKNAKLDYICDAILNGKPVFGEGRWPPLSSSSANRLSD